MTHRGLRARDIERLDAASLAGALGTDIPEPNAAGCTGVCSLTPGSIFTNWTC